MSLMTIEEITDKMKVDQRTIYTWRKDFGLPYIKIGNKIYFREESVNKWLQEREVKQ